MRKSYVTLSIIIAIVAAVGAAAVVIIEMGLAFQSETDSKDDIKVGDYVSARDSNNKMVSINPVVYAQSADKESYVLTNVNQSVRGTLEIGTEDGVERDLTSLITFQEDGTWLLIETMELTVQREIYFTVVVSTSVTGLDGLTVITIDSSGHVTKNYNDRQIAGDWKVWGVGPVHHNYDPTAQGHENDPYKGFLVLVDSSYLMIHHYNVLAISGANSSIDVTLHTSNKAGAEIFKSGEWRVWKGETPGRGYILKSSDLYRCVEQSVHVSIFDSLAGEGIAGKQTDPITVRTGFYSFTINIQYKSSIKIDPTDFEGANMKSNVVFLLKHKPVPEPTS